MFSHTISNHYQININIILKYPNFRWIWSNLSKLKNPHLKWTKSVLCNPNITEEYLLSCKPFPPRTNEWVSGKNISMEFIKKYKPTWKRLRGVLSNPNISLEDIEEMR